MRRITQPLVRVGVALVRSWPYWFNGGEFDDQRVGPSGVIGYPLGAHHIQAQPVFGLFEARGGVNLGRVFEFLAVVTENFDGGRVGGFDRFEQKLASLAAQPFPLLGEECIDGFWVVLVAGEPNVFLVGNFPRSDLIPTVGLDRSPRD